jgi:hypothetical protein
LTVDQRDAYVTTPEQRHVQTPGETGGTMTLHQS